jgi:ethanolamine ammonia-lyase large subunit
LKQAVAMAQQQAGKPARPWVHLNDVAGFIGPEVFRTREQLVRCCLEDIVMGKLHGLCIGLDVCSTLHMDVSLDDLDWCLDRILPANPAYLMALPTKIDPMLGYLTTGYLDHVRLRKKFGYRVDDRMWRFFQQLEVIDNQGQPTQHFGDPLWVYLKYRRRKNDARPDDEIRAEGRRRIDDVRARGLFIAQGRGEQTGALNPELDRQIRQIYADAKKCIWTELTPTFVASIPGHVPLATRAVDRNDYILHPESGEQLREEATRRVLDLRRRHAGKYNVQLVISDGLNALALMDHGQLLPFLNRLREQLEAGGFRTAPEQLVLRSGRVRAGYRIGETLFAGLPDARAILHVIGERPGSGHHTFSIYLTAPQGTTWSQPGKVDHNITKVVSGVATTALAPRDAADETVRLLRTLV